MWKVTHAPKFFNPHDLYVKIVRKPFVKIVCIGKRLIFLRKSYVNHVQYINN